MSNRDKPAAKPQPVIETPALGGTTTLEVKHNAEFKVTDNTNEERVPPPATGKAKTRKDTLTGFKVVDYV